MTLMMEITHVVTKKRLFDNRVESFLITTIWKFWTDMVVMQASKSLIFESNSMVKKQGFQMGL